jgi:arylsulfatase A-like enzyme
MTSISKQLSILALLSGGLLSFAHAAERPNVVILIGDDVGYSDLGSYGSEIETPNLDALATEGTLFSNYHTTASCSPTRSMVYTGVDTHRNGLGGMYVTMPEEHRGQPGYEGVLNDKVATLAEMLSNNEYHTYHTGKWHLGSAPEKRPYNRGYDRTIALGNTGADNWEQRTYLPIDDKAHWYADGEEHRLPDDFYSSKYFVDKAIEFIDSNHGDGQPFFASIGFQAVHIPIQAPKEFTEKYLDTYQQGWEVLREQRRDRAAALGLIPENAPIATMSTTTKWDDQSELEKEYSSRKMAVYAGMLDAMDHHVGRLVAHLKTIGEYDNTLFVFISDNGAEPSDPLAHGSMAAWVKWNFSVALEDLGSKGAYAAIGPSWASAAASPGGFYKFYAGEGGVRVPMIISWPSKLAGGKLADSFAHTKDIVPTILEATGTANHNGNFNGKTVEKITGSSLLPMLSGKAEYTHAADKAIGYELAGNAALYKGQYKLLKNLTPIGDGEWHLYDISKDPGEVQDLRDDKPERFAEMLADYQQYAEENGVLPMPNGYEYIAQLESNSRAVLLRRWWPKALAWLSTLLMLIAVSRRIRSQ